MCLIVPALKELSASASDTAPVSIERCFALVADVEHYPDWYPAGVKKVEVLERGEDGRARLVAAVLAVGDGPLHMDFDLRMAVTTTEPGAVELARVKKDEADGSVMVVSWELAASAGATDAEQTELSVSLHAALSLPPFLPVKQIAQSVANGFLAAALARLRAT
jgi:ribosome-associated toxin RatA of RatAB toxin-antitoxin module